MPAAINAITMTLIQQPGKEKLLISKTKTHRFETASICFTSTFLNSPHLSLSSK